MIIHPSKQLLRATKHINQCDSPTPIRLNWVTSSCVNAADYEEWYTWHHNIGCTATETLEQNIQHSSALNVLSFSDNGFIKMVTSSLF